jgi:hypothetical protein
MKKLGVFFSVFLLMPGCSSSKEPNRDKGLSVHMLPNRVAALKGEAGGFQVFPQHGVKELTMIPGVDELVAFYKNQGSRVQKNGIWIVVTNPKAYSEEEFEKIEILKKICIESEIPLFIARAKNLPGGWERYS